MLLYDEVGLGLGLLALTDEWDCCEHLNRWDRVLQVG